MEHRHMGAGTFGLIVFGLLTVFKPLRYIFYILLIIVAVLFIKDWMSEKIIEDDGTWDYQISSIEQMPYSTDNAQIFQAHGTFENNGQQFIQSFVVSITLYRCPDDNAPINECRKTALGRQLVRADIGPGFAYDFNPRVTFFGVNAGNLRPILNVEDVTVDTDRTN